MENASGDWTMVTVLVVIAYITVGIYRIQLMDRLATETKKGDMAGLYYIAGTDITVMEVVNYILNNNSNTQITLLCPGVTDEQVNLVRQAMDKGGLTKETVGNRMTVGNSVAFRLVDEEGNEVE